MGRPGEWQRTASHRLNPSCQIAYFNKGSFCAERIEEVSVLAGILFYFHTESM